MIFDNLRNKRDILPDKVRELLSWGESAKLDGIADGRHELEDGCFFLMQRYETKPEDEVRFEAHKKYADLQLVRTGRERMTMNDVTKLECVCEYDAQKDAGFYEGENRVSMEFGENDWALFLPSDAHKSSMDPASGRSSVEKLVIKIPLGLL